MSANRYSSDLVEGVRLLIVAGISVGVLVAGVDSRLAMLLLRTSSGSRRATRILDQTRTDAVAAPGRVMFPLGLFVLAVATGVLAVIAAPS